MKPFEDVSPTFCSLPWIHLSTTPNGKAKICCIAGSELKNSENETYSLEKHKISDVWNSEQLLAVRKKMLNGEKVEACSQCYMEEELGGHSMRIGFNDKWHVQEKELVYQRVEESKKNGYKLESMPWYYDLRQGNLCNLKCRSCSPHNSISIEKEYQKISKNDPWFAKNMYHPELEESYRSWFNNEDFNTQLSAQIPNIKKFYFTGGEPTLIERNYDLLQHCIDTGHASHIELMFNTNLTNMSDRFLTLLKSFKNVMLNLSIEGFEKEQEYLRGNSKWPVIDANLRKLGRYDGTNIQILITPVIQACNVLTIDKLFSYVENLNEELGKDLFHFMPIFLSEPRYLEMSILPETVRFDAADRLETFLKKSKIPSYDKYFETKVNQIILKLREKSVESAELIDFFIQFTRSLDAERKQSFKHTFPELFEKWSKSSSHFEWNRHG